MKQIEEKSTRVLRTRKETKNSYDRLSRFYPFFNFFEGKYKKAGIQTLDLKRGESVLEIGFGTGNCLANITESVGNSGRAYGIDISENMCRTAKATINKISRSSKVDIVCGDALNIPFMEQSFDAVFMSFVLDLFDTSDIPLVLDECRRVLKIDGRICIVALATEGKETSMPDIYGWLHEHYQSVFDCRQIPLRESVQDGEFKVLVHKKMALLGLPIDIVLGKK